MKRKIKHALTEHWLTDGRRFSKTDRQHLLTKCKKRSMRRFIQRDAEKEIEEGLEWMRHFEEEESERMVLSYFGEERGKEILK